MKSTKGCATERQRLVDSSTNSGRHDDDDNNHGALVDSVANDSEVDSSKPLSVVVTVKANQAVTFTLSVRGSKVHLNADAHAADDATTTNNTANYVYSTGSDGEDNILAGSTTALELLRRRNGPGYDNLDSTNTTSKAGVTSTGRESATATPTVRIHSQQQQHEQQRSVTTTSKSTTAQVSSTLPATTAASVPKPLAFPVDWTGQTPLAGNVAYTSLLHLYGPQFAAATTNRDKKRAIVVRFMDMFTLQELQRGKHHDEHGNVLEDEEACVDDAMEWRNLPRDVAWKRVIQALKATAKTGNQANATEPKIESNDRPMSSSPSTTTKTMTVAAAGNEIGYFGHGGQRYTNGRGNGAFVAGMASPQSEYQAAYQERRRVRFCFDMPHKNDKDYDSFVHRKTQLAIVDHTLNLSETPAACKETDSAPSASSKPTGCFIGKQIVRSGKHHWLYTGNAAYTKLIHSLSDEYDAAGVERRGAMITAIKNRFHFDLPQRDEQQYNSLVRRKIYNAFRVAKRKKTLAAAAALAAANRSPPEIAQGSYSDLTSTKKRKAKKQKTGEDDYHSSDDDGHADSDDEEVIEV